MHRFCLPIVASSARIVEELLSVHGARYECFEVWLDYLDPQDEEAISSLVKTVGDEYGERVIFLFRRQKLEPISMSFELRSKLVDLIASTKAYLDIDIRTQPEELQWAREKKELRTILSYHNYEFTPGKEALYEILHEMEAGKACISKIATYCRSAQDALRLLELLVEFRGGVPANGMEDKGRRVIFLGMGEYGLITRVFGPLWGNELSFVPEELDGSTAPGQLIRADLEKVLSILARQS